MPYKLTLNTVTPNKLEIVLAFEHGDADGTTRKIIRIPCTRGELETTLDRFYKQVDDVVEMIENDIDPDDLENYIIHPSDMYTSDLFFDGGLVKPSVESVTFTDADLKKYTVTRI